MHIRVVIAALLLLIILGSGIGIAVYMDHFCGELLARIAESADHIRSDGRDDGLAFEQAAACWEEKISFVCCFAIHDQVDLVSQAFFQAKGFLDSETWDEYLSCLNQLTFLLNMIRDYDKPTVRSIL